MGRVKDAAGNTVEFSGGALILGPDGRFVARSALDSRRAHMIVADLDLEKLRRLKTGANIAHRRSEVYVEALHR